MVLFTNQNGICIESCGQKPKTAVNRRTKLKKLIRNLFINTSTSIGALRIVSNLLPQRRSFSPAKISYFVIPAAFFYKGKNSMDRVRHTTNTRRIFLNGVIKVEKEEKKQIIRK